MPKRTGMDGQQVVHEHPLVCIECSRPWVDPKERWRLYLTDDESPEAVPYCPACASYEFDA